MLALHSFPVKLRGSYKQAGPAITVQVQLGIAIAQILN